MYLVFLLINERKRDLSLLLQFFHLLLIFFPEIRVERIKKNLPFSRSDQIIQSNVILTWGVIGWLWKCCKRNYFEANAKLALFYVWLFSEEVVDSMMNIETAMLLMVNSVPKYVVITLALLEFLFLLVDSHDVPRKEAIVLGVSAAFSFLRFIH